MYLSCGDMGAINKSCTILLVSVFIIVLIIPTATSSVTTKETPSNYVAQYSLLDRTLTLFIQPSLYIYYNNQSHAILQDSNYTNFITPQAVQPIADTIWEVTKNMDYPQEQFADAVLALVHQIPYNITGAKFPVETLVDNRGDCGALSLLAASIMKAGGLDVVLIKYTTSNSAHMNVGVFLPEKPVYTSLFFSSTSMQYDNKTYWTAEATPEINWKVGDQSPSLATAITEIIPIGESEQQSPGQISCSLSSLAPSNISLDVSSSPPDIMSNRSLMVSGSIEPAMPNKTVTIYFAQGNTIGYIKTVTNENGAYAYLWNFTSDGTYFVSASFSGNATFMGADSGSLAVFIGPPSLLQFQTETYNYFFGVPIADVSIRPYIGTKDFLNAQVEPNVSFSYSFSVLSTGHTVSDVPTKNITVPGSQYTIRYGNRESKVIQVPPKTVTVPGDVPAGLTPLALPKDFNETVNSQFCFVFQKQPEGNYTFGAQGLDGYDINGIKDNNSSTVFYNATQAIDESTWYKVSTITSQNRITADLQKVNGTVQAPSTPQNLEATSQIVLLIANNVDCAIVLKDFQVSNTTKPATEPTSQTVHQLPPPMKSLVPFAVAVVIIASVLIVTGIIIDLRKTRKRKK
jgi:hypothetical protein